MERVRACRQREQFQELSLMPENMKGVLALSTTHWGEKCKCAPFLQNSIDRTYLQVDCNSTTIFEGCKLFMVSCNDVKRITCSGSNWNRQLYFSTTHCLGSSCKEKYIALQFTVCQTVAPTLRLTIAMLLDDHAGNFQNAQFPSVSATGLRALFETVDPLL